MTDPDYTQEYFEQHKGTSIINKLFIHLIDRREPTFRFITKEKPKGSTLLDAGCGNGNFLKQAVKHFECEGFDASGEAVEIAQKEVPEAKTSIGNLYEVSQKVKEKYDVVTCFDVLEHIVDPRKALLALKVLMKEDGLLVVSMPNGRSLGRKLQGKNWYAYQDLTHIWYYSPSHWEMLLCEAGLIVEMKSGDGMAHPPYVSWMPKEVQILLIKYPTQMAAIYNLPLPESWNETIYFVCRKNPGWESEHYKRQEKLVLQSRI